MCQLLALNCAEPTDVTFSFTGFATRGGLTDHHADGWGIAYYDEKAWRLFVDDKPAAQSPMANFLKHHPIKSRNVIAHVRKATKGDTSVENCHPFMRELRGEQWVFAHNGDLDLNGGLECGPYAPVGTTDSEAAFCMLMNVLYSRFTEPSESPDAVFDIVEEVTKKFTEWGIFNFLLSNGRAQFAYCSTRLSYVIRHWPFSSARLVDDDLSIDFAEHGTETDRTVVIATTPLTDEAWTICQPGDLLMFRDGVLQRQAHVPVPPEVLARSKYALCEASR